MKHAQIFNCNIPEEVEKITKFARKAREGSVVVVVGTPNLTVVCRKTKTGWENADQYYSAAAGMIPLNQIRIPKIFGEHIPHPAKFERYADEGDEMSNLILLDHSNRLMDGYSRYLYFQKTLAFDEYVPVFRLEAKIGIQTYVFAKYDGCGKEYVWRLPERFNPLWIKEGSRVLVDTNSGKQLVVVTRVETLSQPPVQTHVKDVLKILPTAYEQTEVTGGET